MAKADAITTLKDLGVEKLGHTLAILSHMEKTIQIGNSSEAASTSHMYNTGTANGNGHPDSVT